MFSVILVQNISLNNPSNGFTYLIYNSNHEIKP